MPAAKTVIGNSEDSQIKDNEPATQVEAHGHLHLGDEKRMLYRKRVDSNAEISVDSPSEYSSEELSSDNQNMIGFNPETHKKLIKDIIAGVLDG